MIPLIHQDFFSAVTASSPPRSNLNLITMISNCTLCIIVVLCSFSTFLGNLGMQMLFPLGVVACLGPLIILSLMRRDTKIVLAEKDFGILLLYLAISTPALLSQSSGKSITVTLVGLSCTTLGVYVIARLSGSTLIFLTKCFLIMCAVHSFYAICQCIPGLGPRLPFRPIVDGFEVLDVQRASGLFNNANDFGEFVACVICLCMAVGLRRRWMILIPVCCVGLLLSFSRESLIGLLAGLSVNLPKHKIRTILVIVTIIILCYTMIFFDVRLIDRFDPTKYSSDENWLVRLEVWSEALAYIMLSPIIGHGQDVPFKFIDMAYLVWLAQGGVLGFSLWASGLFLLICRAKILWSPFVVMLVIGLASNSFTHETLFMLMCMAGVYRVDSQVSQKERYCEYYTCDH